MKIFSVILPARISVLLLSEFVLTFVGFLVACFLFVQGDTLAYLAEERGWSRLLVASLSVSLGLFVNNLYAKPRVESRIGLALRLSSVFGIALIMQGLLAYLPSGLTLPRAVMIGGTVILFAGLYILRVAFSRVVLTTAASQQILFVGFDSVSEEIAERVATRPELGYQVAGYVSDDSRLPDSSAVRWLGSSDQLEEIAGRFLRPRLIVAAATREFERPLAALLRIAHAGSPVEESASVYETVCGRVCSRQLRPNQIIFFNELPAKPGSVALQSIYTNFLALGAILITSPLLLLAAIAVKLTSRGPVLERDMRVGLHGIPFSLHRFRCHRLNQAARTQDELLTPVGKLLQAVHLVNWPRLFNLLRGEITLVGPRPEKPEFAAELSRYFAYYGQRHSIKPGMTGWSQINVRGEGLETDSLRELEYDLYYTKHISLPMDAYILLHGIRALLPFARQSA